MSYLVEAARRRIESPEKRKFIKYSMVSVVSVVVTEVVLFICYRFLHQSGGWSGFEASVIAAVPSYYLNRSWVWKKGGRSHFLKEVVPFWVMAFIGIGFSAWVSDLAEVFARDITGNRSIQGIILQIVNVAAFGVLWIVKYIIFNKILFAHKPQELEDEPALDGRTGLPT
jgi:putative flippase GtrA